MSPASLSHDLRIRDVRTHSEGIRVIEQLFYAPIVVFIYTIV
jgi:hypothetical protein